MLYTGKMCNLQLISIWFMLGLLSSVLAQDPVAILPQGRIVGVSDFILFP